MTYRVVVTPDAEADLRTTYYYIRKRGAPQAAKLWLRGIRSRIKTLRRHPERAPMAPESALFREPIHESLHGAGNRGSYRILFTILGRTVVALNVRHGSMLLIDPTPPRPRETDTPPR